MATSLTFTQSAAEQAINTVQAQVENITSTFNELKSASDAITEKWAGDGSVAFANKFTELFANYQQLVQAFSDGMAAAKAASQTYNTADETSTSTVNGVDSAVGNVPKIFP